MVHGGRIRHATLAGLVCAACVTEERRFPEPPPGAELVLEIGDLEIYETLDGELCNGTLTAIEQHTLGLSDLFGLPAPRAHLTLHASVDQLDELCPVGTAGCAASWGGHALARTARHELLHIFVLNSIGVLDVPGPIEEGLAFRLDGSPTDTSGLEPISLDQLASILAMRDFTGRPDPPIRGVFAWLLDTFGIEAMLEAHRATAAVAGGDDVAPAFAASFGFDSLQDLHAQYLEGHAVYYPRLPNTVPVVTPDELQAGIDFDTSCEGRYAQGPSDGMVTTTVRLEITRAGEYEMSYAPLPFVSQRPFLHPAAPVHGAFPTGERIADFCSPSDVTRLLFPAPGHYELSYEHPIGEPYRAPLSARYVGEQCSPP